jgi:hypothetical protein
MKNEEVITQLTALKGQHENEAMMLGIAIDLITNGYTSDNAELIATKEAFDTASERIATLEAAASPVQADTRPH